MSELPSSDSSVHAYQQLQDSLQAVMLESTGSVDQAQALIYDDLKHLARRISGEFRSGETLRTTALLHEAYARLAGGSLPPLENRRAAMALMATVMRRVAVDHIRSRTAAKRGGNMKQVPLEEASALSQSGNPDELILGVDHALAQLSAFAPDLARLVELLFFVGLSQAEVAQLDDTSERSVRRGWRKARAWLHRIMTEEGADGPA
ncbi:MAG: ECF-type sigma factor [Lysobacterales bacterium]